MLLDYDESISKELDGSYNESFCKWCYSDNKFVYKSLEQLLDFLVQHMSNMYKKNPEKIRVYLETTLSMLDMWKRQIKKRIDIMARKTTKKVLINLIIT